MSKSTLEKIGAELYETYRTDHTGGYSVTRTFIDNLSDTEKKTLRDSYITAREKQEKDNLLGHIESFWAMYDELQ